MALRDGEIDPASFTILRLGSGALVLLVIRRLANRTSTTGRHGSWLSALCLFVYALSFSYAYVSLSTGVGALILFGFVQATMITSGLLSGDRPVISEWVGWLIAIAGIAMLLLPGADKPDLSGALMMAVSGIAWGLYSVRGRTESNALGATTTNFTFAFVFVLVLLLLETGSTEFSRQGAVLAITSGAITSGLGYVLWYRALEYLTASRAALVQLSVPVIATLGGIFLLAEPLSLQMLVSSAMVLGGIGLALVKSRKPE